MSINLNQTSFTLNQLPKVLPKAPPKVLGVGMAALLSLTACQKPDDKPNPSEGSTAASASAVTATGGMAGKTIKIATEGTYKPFSITNADGSMTGFDIELMRALCADMKANCEFKAQDWEGLIPGLLAKKYDAIIDAMSMTPERQAQVDFSDPYFTNTLVFVTKKGNTINPDDPAQIDSHTIAAQRSSLSSQWLDKNHPKAQLKLYENIDNAFLDLASGRSELMIADKAPAAYWTTTPEGKGFEIKGKEIDVNDKMGIIVRKGDPLRQEFNTALAHVKASGEYDKIYQKYFGNITTTTAAASSTITKTTTAASGIASATASNVASSASTAK